MTADRSTFVFISEDGKRTPGHRHSNPDGSIGGYVADTAVVSSLAHVHSEAFVAPGEIVAAGVHVEPEVVLSVEEGESFQMGPLDGL